MAEANKRITEKPLPVMIGENYEHAMARATIEQTAAEYGYDDRGARVCKKEAEVVITIVSTGPAAQHVGDFVAANEIVALHFSGVPVRPL